MSGKDPAMLNQLINTEMEKVQSWFLANKLQINYTKTYYMIFKSRNVNFDHNLINININNIMKGQLNSLAGEHGREPWRDHVAR